MFNFYLFFLNEKSSSIFPGLFLRAFIFTLTKKIKNHQLSLNSDDFFLGGGGERGGILHKALHHQHRHQRLVAASCAAILQPPRSSRVIFFGGFWGGFFCNDNKRPFYNIRGYRKTWRGPPDAASRNQIFHLENSS